MLRKGMAMVKRERFIRKIEELGYLQVEAGKGQILFKNPKTFRIIAIKQQENLPAEVVRLYLHAAGEDPDCIEAFIANN